MARKPRSAPSAQGPQNSAQNRAPGGHPAGAGAGAGAAEGMGAGAGGGMMGSMLSGMFSRNTLKIGSYAALAAMGYGALREYMNFLVGGGKTNYDLRTQVEKDAALGPARMDKGALDKALGSSSGRDGVDGGEKLSASLGGQSGVDKALDVSAHSPLDASKAAGITASDAPGLKGAMSGQVVRLSLPGAEGVSHDFAVKGAVNDQSALAEFKQGYGEFSKKHGLPAELPQGASLMVGDPGGLIRSAPENAREYRSLGGDKFEHNSRMTGSLSNPGGAAWSQDPAFRSGALKFSSADVAAGSEHVVQSQSVAEQAGSSSLLRQSEKFGLMGHSPVSTPTSFGDSLLGRDGARDFSDFAGSVGAVVGESNVVRTNNLETGEKSVGVETDKGGVAFSSGPGGDKMSFERADAGLTVFAQRSGKTGELGAFGDKGNFAATDTAAHSMIGMEKAADSAAKSPVVKMANGAGVEAGKAISIDMTPGNESVTTRVAYADRVVDYQAKNGSMTMIERDPVSHEPRDAAMIRSQGIRVRDGQIEMDDRSKGVLKDHVEMSAQGRPPVAFAKAHPETRENFASVADSAGSLNSGQSKVSLASRGALSADAGASDVGSGKEGASAGGSRVDQILGEGKKQMAAVPDAGLLSDAIGMGKPKSSNFEMGG